MAKATHRGTCQVCGNVQKLPNGLLSKHGYTKEWGFFQGTCWGAEHLPFQQNIDLIERAIERAKELHADLTSSIATLLEDESPSMVWAHPFRAIKFDRRGRKDYQWELIPIENITEDGRWYTDLDGQKYQSAVYGLLRENVRVAVAKELNGRRAAYLQREADRVLSYIKWQERRIKNWTEHSLLPLEKD